MNVFAEGTKLYSIVYCKCPKCNKGNLFSSQNHYALKNMLAMPDACPICGQDFQIEPGFYLGAMWVSYPLVLLIEIVLLLTGLYVFKMEIVASFIFATGILLLLSPPIMRYARTIYINLFVHYDADALLKK